MPLLSSALHPFPVTPFSDDLSRKARLNNHDTKRLNCSFMVAVDKCVSALHVIMLGTFKECPTYWLTDFTDKLRSIAQQKSTAVEFIESRPTM